VPRPRCFTSHKILALNFFASSVIFLLSVCDLSQCCLRATNWKLWSMGDQAQAVFQEAFRSGVARAYNLSTESDIISDPELFYSNFQQNISIWNPNIPIDAPSSFPGASRVIWDFPLKNELRTDLLQICVSSPFESFGRAISCLTMPFISLGLSNAPSSDLNLAAEYGIYKDGVAAVSNMTRTFASYLADTSSREPTCDLQTLIRNNATLNLQGAAECLRANCVNASLLLKISPDIIGIGVRAYFPPKRQHVTNYP